MNVYDYPGLQGLEIWHGLTRHSTLYQLRDDKPAYFAGLAEFLGTCTTVPLETARNNPLGAAANFQRLLLTGGDAEAALGRARLAT